MNKLRDGAEHPTLFPEKNLKSCKYSSNEAVIEALEAEETLQGSCKK